MREKQLAQVEIQKMKEKEEEEEKSHQQEEEKGISWGMGKSVLLHFFVLFFWIAVFQLQLLPVKWVRVHCVLNNLTECTTGS